MMTLNPPPRVRVALYLLGLLAAPAAVYGVARGWLGEPEAALIAAYLAIVNGLAASNAEPSRDQAN